MPFKLINAGKHGHITSSQTPICRKISATEYINTLSGEIILAQQKNEKLARNANRTKQNIIDVVNYHVNVNTRFITLTFKAMITDKEFVIKCLKEFRRSKIFLGCFGREYTFVLEFQKRGSLHVHLVAYNAKNWINKKELAELKACWKKCIAGRGSVNLETIDDGQNAGVYLAKYIYKECLLKRLGGRFVIHSKNLTRPQPQYINFAQVEKIVKEKNAKKREYTITTESGFEFSVEKWFW